MGTASIVLAAIQLSAAIVHQPYRIGPLAPAAVPGCAAALPAHRVAEGDLPPGLVLSAAGYLQGAPTQAGYYRFAVELDSGCARYRLPVQIAVLSPPLLTVHTVEVELTGNEKRTILRVSSNWANLPYSVETEAAWLRMRPLRGRTPRPGQALEADLVEIEADAAAAGSEGVSAVVRFSCWRCANSPEVRVVLR